MKQAIRQIMQRYPDLARPIWRLLFPVIHRPARFKGDEYIDRKTAFDTIFHENRWQSDESVSGTGSTLEATSMLTQSLPSLLARYNAKVFLDAPCGDFNWMQHVNLSGIHYIGGDIVPELVDRLQQKYRTQYRQFQTLDFVDDPLPEADIWMCRHVLFHLSHEDICKALLNFVDSSIGYILIDNVDFITNHSDIRSGGFRLVNLRAAPFKLPKPLARIANSNPPNPPDYLNLWSREQVGEALGLS